LIYQRDFRLRTPLVQRPYQDMPAPRRSTDGVGRKPGPSAKVQQVQQLMMAFARPLPTTQVCDLTRPRIDAF
jgi:hypothetical protein